MENRWIGQMDSNSLKRLVDDQFPLQSNKTSSMRDLLGSSQTGTSGNPSKKIIKSSTLDGMAPPMSIAGVQIHPKSSYFEFSPSTQKPANKIFNPSQGRSNTHNFSDVSGEDIFNAFEATENRNQSQDQNNIDLFSDNSNFQSNSKNNENLLYMSSFENQNPVSKRLNSKQDHILNNFIEFSDSNNDRTTQNNKNDGLFDQYEGNASKNDSFVSSNNLNRLNNKQNILMSNFANNDDNDISIFDDNTNNNFDNNEEWNQEVSLFDSVKPTSTSSSEKSIIENNRSDEIHLNILENREEGESLLHRMNEDFDERTENPENLAIDLKFPSDFLPRQTRIPAAEAKLGKMPIFGSPELEREHFNSLKSQEQSQNRFEFKNKLNDKEEKIGDIEIYTPEEENLTGNQSGFVFPESAIEFIAKMKESTDELHLSFSDEETEILRNKSKETQSTFQPSFDSFTPTFSEKEESTNELKLDIPDSDSNSEEIQTEETKFEETQSTFQPSFEDLPPPEFIPATTIIEDEFGDSDGMIEIVDDSSSSSKNSESSCKDEEESHQQSSISIHSKQLQTKEKVIAKNENEFQIVIEPKTESEPKTEIDTTIGNEEGFDEEDQKLRSFTLMKLPDLPYPTICNKFSFENQIQYKEPSKKLQFKAPNFPKKDEQLNQKSCSNQNYQKSPKNMSNDEPLSDKFGIIAAMQKSKSQSQSSTIISENEKHLRYQKRSFPKITEKIEETKSFEIFSKYIESLNNQCP